MKTLSLIFTILLSANLYAFELPVKQSRKLCPGKTLYVTAATKYEKEFKFSFAIISSMIIDVYIVDRRDGKTKFAIRTPSPYSSNNPLRPEIRDVWYLVDRIGGIIESIKDKYEVSNITVSYDPRVKCSEY